MRNLNPDEKEIITRICAAAGDQSVTIESVLKSFYFTEASGRALIIQTQGDYAVLFLKPDLYNDQQKRNEEVKKFFDLLFLLSYLVREGYLLLYKAKNEKIYFIQDEFDAPRILNNSIILNKKGDFTSVPDTIHDISKNIIYKGIEFRGDQYRLILEATNGSMIIPSSLEHLLTDSPSTGDPAITKTPENQAVIKKRRAVVPILTLLFAVITCLAVLLAGWFFLPGAEHFNKQLQTIVAVNDTLSDTLAAVSSVVRNLVPPAHPLDSGAHEIPGVLYGVDISKWNGNEAEEITGKDSISFVICKATEGRDYLDPEFKRNWEIINSRDFITGAYHFYHTNQDPAEQAAFFWSIINHPDQPDMAPIVDIEQSSIPPHGNPDPANIQKELLAFLRKLEALSGRTPIVYTNPSFADTYLLNDSLSRYPLWLSAFTNTASPRIPKTWENKGYKLWQRRDNYFIDSHASDFDIYYGTRTGLVE